LNIPDACQQGDGHGCYGCCEHTPCTPGDSRSSCQGNNVWECDLCQWTAQAEEAAKSQRATVCDHPFVEVAAVYREQFLTCTSDPYDPFTCCDSCGCHSCYLICPIEPT
jgi:hypothetical protein